MKPDAECHRSFRCRQLFPKNKMHATSLPETSRTHVNTHKLGPHSPARLAIYGFLFGPIMIFDGHNFNLQGLRWTKGSPELAMSWPAVPCLACFSQFPPTATEHRLQVGQFLSPARQWTKFCPLQLQGGFCPHRLKRGVSAICMLLNVIAR